VINYDHVSKEKEIPLLNQHFY